MTHIPFLDRWWYLSDFNDKMYLKLLTSISTMCATCATCATCTFMHHSYIWLERSLWIIAWRAYIQLTCIAPEISNKIKQAGQYHYSMMFAKVFGWHVCIILSRVSMHVCWSQCYTPFCRPSLFKLWARTIAIVPLHFDFVVTKGASDVFRFYVATSLQASMCRIFFAYICICSAKKKRLRYSHVGSAWFNMRLDRVAQKTEPTKFRPWACHWHKAIELTSMALHAWKLHSAKQHDQFGKGNELVGRANKGCAM